MYYDVKHQSGLEVGHVALAGSPLCLRPIFLFADNSHRSEIPPLNKDQNTSTNRTWKKIAEPICDLARPHVVG